MFMRKTLLNESSQNFKNVRDSKLVLQNVQHPWYLLATSMQITINLQLKLSLSTPFLSSSVRHDDDGM